MYYQRNQRFQRPPMRGGRSFAPRRNNFRGTYIKPSLFVNKAAPVIPMEDVKSVHQFSDFKLIAPLQQNIEKKGYIQPTPVQDGIIPAALEGRDVIGIANTGTGKTAAFAIPLIQKLHDANYEGQVLIMAPTRELALQIRDEIRSLAYGIPVFGTLCIGGSNMYQQITSLRKKNHFIIGTPGRLKDLLERKVLNLSQCKYLVLDEVDRMLDMGFINDIKFLVSHISPERQTLFFCATITSQIEQLMNQFLRNPHKVSVRTQETSSHVEQDIIKCSYDKKLDVLKEMLTKKEFQKVIIFGRTKHGVEKLSVSLTEHGFRAGSIHGDKPQNKREKVLKLFRSSMLNILVATDVAARGLDIPDVSHVINYDVPATFEDYVHRIGRTGRGNARGYAYTFIEERDQQSRPSYR